MVSTINYYCISILVLLVFSYNPRPAVSRVPHSNLADLESLLAFKAGISDPNDFLATNWTTDASFCDSWFGVECSRRRQRVVKLDIRNLSLHGTLSPHLGNLSFLSYLNLGENYLTGPIPSSIGRLPRLAELGLYINNLSGTIPPTIFNMTSLTKLSLAYNNLSGPLPSNDDLFILPRLQFISLSENFLTGGIPSHLAQCSHLQIISLSSNDLGGRIPPELGNITGLQVLYLAINKLRGTIPASIGNLTMLQKFSIDANYIEGSIPKELGNLLHLQRLRLDENNLTGTIPAALLNASNLQLIELSRNKIDGIIPTTLGKSWPQLIYFDLYDNRLTGGLDIITSLSSSRNLEEVVMFNNELDGTLPESVGNLSTNVQKLDFQYNYIKGSIPTSIGNLSGLIYLALRRNELTGEVPSTLSRLKRLQGVYLSYNRISGYVPIELGMMTSLNYFDLSHNALSGSIPYSLGNISTLQHLNLASNRLFSNIPKSLWRLGGLLAIDLSENMLDGSLPLQMGNLKALDILDLSKNRFSGNISDALGELKMLTYLNLSINFFYGQIPISIKGLINIEYMSLSYNSLSGTIPEILANLSHLRSLDLSFNKLEGQIPQGGAFSNLSILSLEGNAALCGAIQLGFPPCPSKVGIALSKSKLFLLKYILPPIAFVVVLACCLYLGLIHRQRSSKLEVDALNGYKIISYHELARATDHFSDANLLGRGSFSSVFKANLDDGSTIAVKVLNLEDHDAWGSFDVECRVLREVRHRNLVKIINTCSNLDFKDLVLEFMPNGSLEQWLYSHNNYLNLLQRLNIMLDVSLAIEHLHHGHSQIIVHCDLKPSNILLDENMTAHVSDFGISKLLLGDSKSVVSTRAPGTFGYMAPEYISMGRVSRKSDVYSFDILLLETLTRKKPSDNMFEGGLSLRQWVSGAYPDAVLEIVDPNLLTEDYSTRRQQSDSLTNVHECLSTLIELGLQCSRNSPKERIMMKDVVPILENTRIRYLSAKPSV